MTLSLIVSGVVKFSTILKARKERFFSYDNLTRLKKLRGNEGTALFSGGGGGGGGWGLGVVWRVSTLF